MLIEELEPQVAPCDEEDKLVIDASNKKLIQAVEMSEDKKKDMFESFKNLSSEFESLD